MKLSLTLKAHLWEQTMCCAFPLPFILRNATRL